MISRSLYSICMIILLLGSGGCSKKPTGPGEQSSNMWMTIAPIPTAREAAASGVIDGKLYVVGGNGEHSELTVLEIYDPDTDSWSTGTSMNEARSHAIAGVIDGKLYVAGGIGTEGSLDVLEIYDPLTDSWSSGAPIPEVHDMPAGGVIDSKLYVVGGSWPKDELHIYDPASDTWSLGASMPTGRRRASAGVINGRLYVAGGEYHNELESYDPASNSWSQHRKIPLDHLEDAAAGVIDNLLYLAGGWRWDPEGPVKRVFVYNPTSRTWQEKAPMRTERTCAAAGVIGGKLYVISGFGGDYSDLYGEYLTSCEVYKP